MTIIQEEGVVSYDACGIPYVIERIVNDFEELVERPPDIFKSKYGIDIIINTRAYKIDRFRNFEELMPWKIDSISFVINGSLNYIFRFVIFHIIESMSDNVDSIIMVSD